MRGTETVSYRVADQLDRRSGWFLVAILVVTVLLAVALAPMPMFSSYSILTAVMILLAAAASLLVLPSLLVLVTPAGTEATAELPGLPSPPSGGG